MTVKVVVDTSLLLCSSQAHKHLHQLLEEIIDESFEVIIPSAVVNELKGLTISKGRRGILAKIAMNEIDYILSQGIGRLVETAISNQTDMILLHLAKDLNACIATADIRLKRKATTMKIPTIVYVKSKKTLIKS
ncbi:MAG: PIN domain-containing protein [Thermofilaceae archaeon]